MVIHIDREAGFATFRQGRSLCLRLDGRLDTRMAHGVAHQIRGEAEATRLRLECSTLRDADEAAARILARAVLAWAQSRDDRSVDILNLAPRLHRALEWHPLRAIATADELLFFDPDHEPDTPGAARPSRH